MNAERQVDIHFRMLDARNNAPIRYERINSETGEEVPWKEVAKAFQYEKGGYVVVEKEDFARAAPGASEAVEIEAFIGPLGIGPQHFARPYSLVPAKEAEKGCLLLHKTLRRMKLAALARGVIRTRKYLALVLPAGNALLLELLRYPQDLIASEPYQLSGGCLV